MRSFHPRPRLGRHVVLGAAAIIIGLALLGCGSDRSVVSTLEELHGLGDDDKAAAEAVSEMAPAVDPPEWCDAGRELDTIHLAFHDAGDTLPSGAEIARAVDAAGQIESTTEDATLAADAATMGDGLTITVEQGSAAIFQEEPYTSAATNVFDAIEAQCPAG